MDEKEVIQDLRSKVKPYNYVVGVSQSTFSNVLTRHEAGLLKPKTLVKFLEKFGYFKQDGVWLNTTMNFEVKPQIKDVV